GGDRLEGRTSRIAALIGAIDQRVAGAVAERVVLLLGVRLGVEGRVVRGIRAHPEDRARTDVHCDDGSRQALGPQLRLADGLQAGVQSQAKVVAGPGGAAAEPAPRMSERIDLNALAAGRAAEELVVGVFDSRLTDDVAGPQAPVSRPGQLMRGDLSDEPENVGGKGSVLVVADIGALDTDAGEAVLVLEQVEEQAPVDALAKDHRVPGVLGRLADLAANRPLREPEQVAQMGKLGP